MLLSVNSFTSFHVIEGVEIDDEETICAEKTHSANLENAIQLAGYGKFHKILLAITGLIYASCAISTTTLSFVLPSAECDFELSSASKGKLSAIPLAGMICGCGVWGTIANCHGRRVAMLCSLLVDFSAAVVSSFASSFPLFMVCRFFNGFGIIGATSIVFTYLGEFLPKSKKDMVLGKLEIFWNVGMFLLPGMGWFILSNRFQVYFNQNFTPWRIFILVCSIPSLLSFIFLYSLPESPKYLISRGKFDEAKVVFKRIYERNTGKKISPHATFFLKGEYDIDSSSYNKHHTSSSFMTQFNKRLEIIKKMLKELCKWAYLKYILIISFADFGLMSSYYTLMIWFPEIFERFHSFESSYPKTTATVCDISKFNSTNDSDQFQTCDASIEDRVFLDTVIIALSCIPTSVCLGIAMKTFGKRTVLAQSVSVLGWLFYIGALISIRISAGVVGLILSGLITMLLNIVRKAVQILVISCIFEALTSVLEAVVFCIVVDVLPTHLSAIAVAITATSGRLGAILGNITFGLLIDVYCVIPIYLFGFLLIASGLLCISLPKRGNYIPIV